LRGLKHQKCPLWQKNQKTDSFKQNGVKKLFFKAKNGVKKLFFGVKKLFFTKITPLFCVV
jgi:hypothetical protein